MGKECCRKEQDMKQKEAEKQRAKELKKAKKAAAIAAKYQQN